jgi:hypothetical protein
VQRQAVCSKWLMAHVQRQAVCSKWLMAHVQRQAVCSKWQSRQLSSHSYSDSDRQRRGRKGLVSRCG